MAFFVARLRHHGIGWSHPMTLFASDLDVATKRLNLLDADALEIRERPGEEALLDYGRTEDQAVAEHTRITWQPN